MQSTEPRRYSRRGFSDHHPDPADCSPTRV